MARRFVIICNSRLEGGEILYLADRRLNTRANQYWTTDVKKALVYNWLQSAQRKCNKLKFNNPRIIELEPDDQQKLDFQENLEPKEPKENQESDE